MTNQRRPNERKVANSIGEDPELWELYATLVEQGEDTDDSWLDWMLERAFHEGVTVGLEEY